MSETELRIFLNDSGNVEASWPGTLDFELPPDTMVKFAFILMKVAGCEVNVVDHKIIVDASRVSARPINTDARRKFDA